MLILRLTNRIVQQASQLKAGIANIPEYGNTWEDWHAHLFFFNRRKYIMFTHVHSLVSFVAGGISKKEIGNVEAVFWREFNKFLVFYKFNKEEVEMLCATLKPMQLAKIIDNGVTRVMVNLIDNYKWYLSDTVHHQGRTPEDYALYQLNRIPIASLKYANGLETFVKLFGTLKSFHHIPGHGVVGLN